MDLSVSLPPNHPRGAYIVAVLKVPPGACLTDSVISTGRDLGVKNYTESTEKTQRDTE